MEINLNSINPKDDQLVSYLGQLQFWTDEIAAIIESRNRVLPECLVDLFRLSNHLPINRGTKAVFGYLLRDMNGYNLSPKELRDIDNPNTPCGKLNQLSLTRIQDQSVLKPRNIAFDPRVQLLICKEVIYPSQ